MSTTLFNTANSGGIDFNATYTAYDQTAAVSSTNSPDNPGPPVAVGTVLKGSGDSEFVFVKAGAAIALGDVCVITSTTQIANPVTTSLALFGLQCGVAQVAIANGAYGWLQRNGKCANINVAASCVQNVQLAATATAGVIDDAVTTGLKNINGIIITTTVTGAATTAGTLNNPVVGITN
jgi:hypothetical protein